MELEAMTDPKGMNILQVQEWNWIVEGDIFLAGRSITFFKDK